MLSPVEVLGEIILDADANNILMGVNPSMPARWRSALEIALRFTGDHANDRDVA